MGIRREHAALATRLHHAGWAWVEIADVFREEHGVSARAALRLAHGWSQQHAAETWSARWPDDPTTAQNISAWERWPLSGYAPSLRTLSRLADMYECGLGDLLVDIDRMNGHRPTRVAFADRASVPRETWQRLLLEAKEQIDVLVFSGTFFAQTQPKIAPQLASAAQRGVHVRLCFGNPNSTAVATRDQEEGLGRTLAAKIRASLTYYRTIVELCEVRLHATTLYNSVFRYDDEAIVNPHVYGEPASANPVLHVRRSDDAGLFEIYADSFERVWAAASPWHGEGV